MLPVLTVLHHAAGSQALASNTIGGAAEAEARRRSAIEEVKSAQSAWLRLGPVPGLMYQAEALVSSEGPGTAATAVAAATPNNTPPCM